MNSIPMPTFRNKIMDKLTLQYWEIRISDYRTMYNIKEIYVPELELCMNCECIPSINGFICNRSRYEKDAKLLKIVELTDSEKVAAIQWYAKVKQEQKEKNEILISLFD
jgi:hypothetical protein